MADKKSKDEVMQLATEVIAKSLSISLSDIDPTHEFVQLGLDSLQAMFVLDELEKKLGVEINPLLFWEFPTPASFVDELYKEYSKAD